ncbi:cell division protein FtsQ [Anaerosporobacter mobilis DSM 15930]|jgi:cell division protein FtsQ|uniref:Cell division protein FtsQ n=1 Tax=Anaerosporobacter mobilis DSM 15930 TaxID=1120996 RepID=A0A1M7EYL1_9FIRM|nr:cell division protein FtsQ/DivIB [Anaerosporobacter mobilis]SHL96954.1 cell division protein FtsQ [Anaerosporobacter mobilis DSM 15930]
MRKVRKYKKRIKAKIILSVFVLLALGLVVFSQVSRIQDIKVIGCERYSQEEIKDILLSDTHYNNSIYLYLKYKYGEPKNVPFIEYMDVKLTSVNTLTVHVYEKSIFGCIKYFGDYMYFDKDGIVVDSSNERYEGIPIVTGLTFKTMMLTEKLTVQKDELFDVIKDLTKLIHKYEINIDTIHFQSNNELILYSQDIKILLGKKDMYDEQIAELKNMLPNIEGKKGTLHMENFTTGNKTYFEYSK